MHLRPATPEDLEVLRTWVPTEPDMFLWSGPTFTWPLDRAQLQTYLSDERRLHWSGSAAIAGRMSGHVSLLVDEAAGRMRLGCVVVDPARRGHGLGRRFVTAAVHEAFRISDLPVLTLGVYAHNAVARRLYGSLGFRETGLVRDTRVGEHIWHVLEMERPRVL
ncbi:GNAT family N-acetyltransferase [Kocuria turfanensis]|uniref:GNAT family N-acetyltransferase n=1 Tax=Kocuria turfanensis TaxID=388357 RepID=UPI0040371949